MATPARSRLEVPFELEMERIRIVAALSVSAIEAREKFLQQKELEANMTERTNELLQMIESDSERRTRKRSERRAKRGVRWDAAQTARDVWELLRSSS